jgi:uncharacterized membrane protein (DUF4010 family)
MAHRARDAIARAGAATAEAGAVLQGPLAAALAASVSTLVQLTGVLVLVNPSLLERLIPALVLAAVVLMGAAAVIASRGEKRATETVALLIQRFGTAWLGAEGAVIASGLVGFVDAHAGALAAATLAARGEIGPPDAVLAIAASLGTNTLVKVVLAFVLGGGRFAGRFALVIGATVLGFGVGVAINP